MDMVAQKRKTLSYYSSKSTSVVNLALTDYIESTKLGTFDGFKLKIDNGDQFRTKSRQYIERLIHELDERFKPPAV